MECPDGRSFQVVNKPLAQGGWVATIEDITERRNLEQERDRNYAFLRQIIDHIPTQITVKDVRDAPILLANRVAEDAVRQCRAKRSSARRRFDLFPQEAAAGSSPRTTRRRCSRPEGLFLDEQALAKPGAWDSATSPHGASEFRDHAGQTRYIINVVDDVTDRRRADEKIAHLAHYDALTDLPNRVLFREQIERELKRTSGGEQFALLYIDVDEFKGINDSLGHHVGDELLKAVAARIRRLHPRRAT